MAAIVRDVTAEGSVGTVNATRAYLTTLRQGGGYTQAAIAELLGMTVKSWRSYEKGHTRDLQYGDVIAVVQFIGGSFTDLQELANARATTADGQRIAEERLRFIASGEIVAASKTYSEAEFTAYLREIQEKVNQLAQTFPGLRSVLGRAFGRPRQR